MISGAEKPLSPAALRKFGLIMALLFTGAALLPRWFFNRNCTFVVAGLFALAALIAPRSLKWVHWGWMKLGGVLGAINSRIILSVLFFLVVLPIGRLRRIFGGDPMARGFDRKARSYRVPCAPPTSTMENPF